MKASLLLLALLFAAGALAVMPSAQAEDLAPDVPSCKPVDRHDGGIHTTVSSDCRTQVDIKTYDCVWNCGWHDVVRTHYLTIRQYGQNNGQASMSASAIELPDPCGPTAYCTGPECPALDVSTTDLFAYLGPHASVSTTNGCHATVQERGLRCAIGTDEVEQTVGPATVGADVCMPVLDCTCDPLPIEASSAMAAQLPVQVEFVQCVTEPCPPMVSCTPATTVAPGFQVSRSRSCHVTITQDPLPCEGSRYETTTVGLVTVRRAYCGPGIEP